MTPYDLVALFAAAVSRSEPMAAARAALEELTGHVAEVDEALRYISGVGGNARQVFYRSPGLTLLKVCFPAARRTPPHDHGTWAAILLLSGEEKNTLYRVEDGRLRKASEVTIKPGTVLGMRAARRRMRGQCTDNRPACLRRRYLRTAAPHMGSADPRGAQARLDALRAVRARCVRGACGAGAVAGYRVKPASGTVSPKQCARIERT